MTPVKSSNIRAVGYDSTTRAMKVQFHDGVTHQYEDVDPKHHEEMMKPDTSVGKYFHAHIKGAHKSKKVE